MTSFDNAVGYLLGEFDGAGWRGELSSSALSTAVAVMALAQVDRARHASSINAGLNWLAGTANVDGGWGDTTDSPSNLSTTLLCWSALSLAESGYGSSSGAASAAQGWIGSALGSTAPTAIEDGVLAHYGNDRTFSAPILMMCALGGRLGDGVDAWARVPQLPFELAVLPHRLFRWLRLQVVSYAIPALIAIGLVRHRRRPVSSWARSVLRDRIVDRVLARLTRMQPSSGGFLEASPLTGFVAMGLAAAGLPEHPVVEAGVRFLLETVRDDGSWAIDRDLSTWVTTLAVNALAAGNALDRALSPPARAAVRDAILEQQWREEHPFTQAAAGGWAWTDAHGGVPDADDTAGALLALSYLEPGGDAAPHFAEQASRGKHGAATTGDAARGAATTGDAARGAATTGDAARGAATTGGGGRVLEAAEAGIQWLLKLQNGDGGLPTFCRGWGRLPFDRSCAGLTAHALHAFDRWYDRVAPGLRTRMDGAMAWAMTYLDREQCDDGSWLPLWFGNQAAPDQGNPVYGTARVVAALQNLTPGRLPERDDLVATGCCYLVSAQNADGGWGGDAGVAPSIEETAMAVAALRGSEHMHAVTRGIDWLNSRTQDGTVFDPVPIGLYFASLWYSERLYPVIFSVPALAPTGMTHHFSPLSQK